MKHWIEIITEYLNTLELSLNGKTQIVPFKNGINYLGFHTYVVPGGNVIRKVRNENKRNAQRKYRRMAKLVAQGRLLKEKLDASYQAYKNHISHGSCSGLSYKMEREISQIIYTKGEKNV